MVFTRTTSTDTLSRKKNGIKSKIKTQVLKIGQSLDTEHLVLYIKMQCICMVVMMEQDNLMIFTVLTSKMKFGQNYSFQIP